MAEKTSPGKFVRQVRREFGRVTWPSRKETMISTGMVMVTVVLAAAFFMLVDQFLAWSVKFAFGLGG